jgi:hypothetical protein
MWINHEAGAMQLTDTLGGGVIDEQKFIGTELAKHEADWYTESEIRNSFCE